MMLQSIEKNFGIITDKFTPAVDYAPYKLYLHSSYACSAVILKYITFYMLGSIFFCVHR